MTTSYAGSQASMAVLERYMFLQKLSGCQILSFITSKRYNNNQSYQHFGKVRRSFLSEYGCRERDTLNHIFCMGIELHAEIPLYSGNFFHSKKKQELKKKEINTNGITIPATSYKARLLANNIQSKSLWKSDQQVVHTYGLLPGNIFITCKMETIMLHNK